MKILFTADLHLLRATQEPTLSKVREWITRYRPDAFVVAGDLSSAQQAEDTLRNLRVCFPQGPIAVCLGNHDFWMLDNSRRESDSLSGIIDRYWAPAAKSLDIVLLDVENLRLQDIAVVGGYGHYDLGFAVPGLAYDGILVTPEDYLRGSPSTNSVLRWRDFQFMPANSIFRKWHANRSKAFEVAWRKPEILEPSWYCIPLLSKSSLVCLHPMPCRQIRLHRCTPFSVPISGIVRWGSYCGRRKTISSLWYVGTPIVELVRLHLGSTDRHQYRLGLRSADSGAFLK